ncbi:unnamed protein product, partial [Rotaria sp. Silwood1]
LAPVLINAHVNSNANNAQALGLIVILILKALAPVLINAHVNSNAPPLRHHLKLRSSGFIVNNLCIIFTTHS